MAGVVVIGAGPAGLTAAWEARRLGLGPVTVLEASPHVGGLARTAQAGPFRFDLGGHRFFTRSAEIEALWPILLGEPLLQVDRRSSIRYRGRRFDYPLRPANALLGLGPVEAARCVASWAQARRRPRPEVSFQDWVTNRFGARLFDIFFRTYTEKVWGIPCDVLSADWAAQRIRGLDLGEALREALSPRGGAVHRTLADRFAYPRLGPGQLWERVAASLDQVVHGARVVRTGPDGATTADGRHFPADALISTMPLRQLVLAAGAPPDVVARGAALRHRGFVTVLLGLHRPVPLREQWLYVHDADLRVGRVQNFGAWSGALVPPGGGSLGLEYFDDEGSEAWRWSDRTWIATATAEAAALGLLRPAEVVQAAVVRSADAYPVYDPGYRERIAAVRAWLTTTPWLQSIGRNGQHRYDNQDHAMMTGLLAARRLAGQAVDPWAVNQDADWLERAAPGAASG